MQNKLTSMQTQSFDPHEDHASQTIQYAIARCKATPFRKLQQHSADGPECIPPGALFWVTLDKCEVGSHGGLPTEGAEVCLGQVCVHRQAQLPVQALRGSWLQGPVEGAPWENVRIIEEQ